MSESPIVREQLECNAPSDLLWKYDHDEVRCQAMVDSDCDNLMAGDTRTCCVCAGHDCEEARAERLKHPAPKPLQTMKIQILRDDKATVVLPDGRELHLVLTTENGEGPHLKISGDDSLVIIPSAPNQIRIKLR